MKRWLSNVLTVLISLFVLAAGALFAYYILPVITEDDEEIRTETIRLSNPQEILNTPENNLAPFFYFPSIFSGRLKLEESQIGEEETKEMSVFLTELAEQLDILFNLKLYGNILSPYIGIWRYDEQSYPNSAPRISQDIFHVDVLFTDARAQVWRISACGSAGQIFHVSCIDTRWEEELLPVFTTQRQLQIYEEDEKIYSVASAFYSKLTSLSTFNRIVTLGLYEPLNVFFVGSSNSDVLWSVHLESDNCFLISGFFESSRTPFSYTFLDFSNEMQYGYYFPKLIDQFFN